MTAEVTERDQAGRSSASPPVGETPRRPRTFVAELYGSALGKKYVMAITGIIGMGYVLAHMIGNLKIYFGAAEYDAYAHFLRDLLYPIVPHTTTLWLMRLVLIAALILHLHAAYALTVVNRRARPSAYRSKRDWIAADFASRSMRWTGIIVLAFLAYHLADFTWGAANPGFVRGEVYRNVVASFSQPVVAAFYIVANVALGIHLFHGGWSLFQSMGWNNRRFNHWRKAFAVGFAVVVVVGNISFPIAVLTGIVA